MSFHYFGVYKHAIYKVIKAKKHCLIDICVIKTLKWATLISGWWLITLHSTITWLTLTRSLGGSYGQIKTLTLYSDPNPFPNQNPDPNPTLTANPNEKFDLLPYIVMSRDVTWPNQFFAYNFAVKHFNPTSWGVIRNQRSKIRRLNIILTSGGPFRKILKFECRVI